MSAPKQQVSPGEPRPAPLLRGTIIVARGQIFDASRNLASHRYQLDYDAGETPPRCDHGTAEQRMKHYVDAPTTLHRKIC